MRLNEVPGSSLVCATTQRPTRARATLSATAVRLTGSRHQRWGVSDAALRCSLDQEAGLEVGGHLDLLGTWRAWPSERHDAVPPASRFAAPASFQPRASAICGSTRVGLCRSHRYRTSRFCTIRTQLLPLLFAGALAFRSTSSFNWARPRAIRDLTVPRGISRMP